MMNHYWRLFYVVVLSLVFIGTLSAQQTNLIANPSVEDTEAGFFTKVNDGLNSSQCIRALETAQDTAKGGQYSYQVIKPNTTTGAVGWTSVNNADLYWNNAAAAAYTLSVWARTQGANTSPANDDAKIRAKFTFKNGGVLLDEVYVDVDQSVANTDWTQYTGASLLTTEPDEVYIELIVGQDATGTVWFDNIGCSTDPWSMGVFGSDAETPVGWMNWTSGSDIGFANVVDDMPHTGTYGVKLEENDTNADEMVFYSVPVAVQEGSWYQIGVWAMTEDVNDSSAYLPSNIVKEHYADRIAVNFFYHADPIDQSWSLVEGDQFMYFDQRNDTTGWTYYSVISQAPTGAAGISMRARYNNDAMGTTWYDDFLIKEVEVVVTNIDDPTNEITLTPVEYELYNNYPNPFNPETIIEYRVPKSGRAVLAIYNVLGKKVRTLVNTDQQAGVYQVHWDGKDNQGQSLATGVYFYQLKGENVLITKKMTLIK